MSKLVFLYFISGIICSLAEEAPLFPLNDGYDIPVIALGTWAATTNYTDAKSNHTKDIIQAVLWAIEAGYRHIDVADSYEVEEAVGEALQKKFKEGLHREEVFVTAKLKTQFHGRHEVVEALKASLKALKLDYVDLYLLHWPVGQFENNTYDLTDYVQTWQGMMAAKEQGYTNSIGVSNFNERQITRLGVGISAPAPAVLQIEINLNLQQSDLLQYCKSKKIVVMADCPFGSLFYFNAKKNAPPPRVDELELVQIAARYNKTVSQLVLRYLLELGVIPLPKSFRKKRIEQNIDIFDFSIMRVDKLAMKVYDENYRTNPQSKWLEHPHYPFEDIKIKAAQWTN